MTKGGGKDETGRFRQLRTLDEILDRLPRHEDVVDAETGITVRYIHDPRHDGSSHTYSARANAATGSTTFVALVYRDDLINQIANRQLYMVAAAAAEVIRQTLIAKEKVAENPAVLEILAYAIRRGLDSPEKVAFAYRTPSARSRVLLHRAFAEKIGDREPMLGSDFEGVMRHLDAVLAFGAFDRSAFIGEIDLSAGAPDPL